MVRICECCNRAFKARPYDVRRGYGKFCSRDCKNEAQEKPAGKENAWRTYNVRLGRWYRRWKSREDDRMYSIPEHRWVWEMSHGLIPDGYDVHHKDGDRHNNDLDNLELLTKAEHIEHHRQESHQHISIGGVVHRKCQKCFKWKPLTKYYKRGGHSYQGYCNSCHKEYKRGRRNT